MATPVFGDPTHDEKARRLLYNMKLLDNKTFWNNISFVLARKLAKAAGNMHTNALDTALMLTEKKRGGTKGASIVKEQAS